MSSIQATDNDTSKFLQTLEAISKEQEIICKRLEELILLMQMPSESVLEVLQGLLIPMSLNMDNLVMELNTQIKAA